LYVETSLGIRFYDVQTGQCISRKNMKGGWIDYLKMNLEDQHHWGIDGYSVEPGKAVLYDLTIGEALHSIERDPTQVLHNSRISSDQHYLLLLWRKKIEAKSTLSYELEIVDLETWKSVLIKPLEKDPGPDGVAHLLNPDLLIQTMHFKENDLSVNSLQCFHFDHARGTLEPDKSHAFHGFVSRDWMFVRNEFLIQHGIRGKHQEILPRWKVVWNFFDNLVRRGQFPEPSGSQDYRVYDFSTGRQLRQLTGLTAFGHQSLFLSQDAHFLLGKEYLSQWNKSNKVNQAFLTLYEIPHYWWEKSWSVTFYLALILLFIWPARFLGRKPV